MKNKLIKEAKLIKLSTFELERRRLNWRLVTQEKIQNLFHKFIEESKSSGYPFRFSCQVHDETKNYTTVQLTAESNKTGVVKFINDGESYGWDCEVEKGSSLVASFSSSGKVAFIMYPYSSERYSRIEKEIIIHIDLSPDCVTDKLVENCIIDYLRYIRASTIYGAYSKFKYINYFRIRYLIFIDARNWVNLFKYFKLKISDAISVTTLPRP